MRHFAMWKRAVSSDLDLDLLFADRKRLMLCFQGLEHSSSSDQYNY